MGLLLLERTDISLLKLKDTTDMSYSNLSIPKTESLGLAVAPWADCKTLEWEGMPSCPAFLKQKMVNVFLRTLERETP